MPPSGAPVTMLKRSVIVGLSLLLPVLQAVAGEPPGVGEKLEYQISWGLITAGYATLEVKPDERVGDQPARVFGMTASSTAFLDKLFKVRDTFTSYVAPDLSHSLKYEQQQQEGHYHRNLSVTFDAAAKTAQATINDKKRTPCEIQPGTFDPLSAMYALRGRTFKLGEVIELPISDGKKCVLGRGTVVREEAIKTAAGKFETFVLEPDFKDVSGVFKKSPGAKIHVWFTKDARHLPVKVASKVFIGSFTAELIKITEPPPAAAAPPQLPPPAPQAVTPGPPGTPAAPAAPAAPAPPTAPLPEGR